MKTLRYLATVMALATLLVITLKPPATAEVPVEVSAVTITAHVTTTTAVDYFQGNVSLDSSAYVHCWNSIAPLRPLAELAMAPMLCGRPADLVEGAIGVFDGVAVIVGYQDDFTSALYRDIAAHEIGHAWDDNVLSARRLYVPVMDALGWTEWHGEAWAETFAYCVGQWELGTDWRHPGHTPTADECAYLTAIGAVPSK